MSDPLIIHLKRWVGLIALVHMISACTPMVMTPGPATHAPKISQHFLSMPDGTNLPLHVWKPEQEDINAVVIALHGFNDYGLFFYDFANYLAKEGVISYAYDQRGFGGSPNTGLWAGADAYIHDLKTATSLIRQRHPEQPVYLFGESMGAAVLMAALSEQDNMPLAIDGLILSAPAVWARETMPFYQRWALWLGSHTIPWVTLTGRGLKIKPSDNIEMLRALGRDPLVIKETRIDAIWGLVNLMDRAMEGAPRLETRTLILYGARDEIIKKHATMEMLRRLPQGTKVDHRVAVYENGYHMLIRDLAAETYWKDIAAWIKNPNGALPSGADQSGMELFVTAP